VIDYLVTRFPLPQHRWARTLLARVLVGVVTQRLVPRSDGRGMIPAVEVLVSNARVKECIERRKKAGDFKQAIIDGGKTAGMQTFDQSLMALYKQKSITFEEALRQSDNREDFKLQASGVSVGAEGGMYADFQPQVEKEPQIIETVDDDTEQEFEFD